MKIHKNKIKKLKTRSELQNFKMKINACKIDHFVHYAVGGCKVGKP